MSKIGRRIAAYHPEIRVRMPDGVKIIEVSLDDWMSDEDVLKALGMAAGTLGELVQDLLDGGDPCSNCPHISCRLVDVGDFRSPIYSSGRKLG